MKILIKKLGDIPTLFIDNKEAGKITYDNNEYNLTFENSNIFKEFKDLITSKTIKSKIIVPNKTIAIKPAEYKKLMSLTKGQEITIESVKRDLRKINLIESLLKEENDISGSFYRHYKDIMLKSYLKLKDDIEIIKKTNSIKHDKTLFNLYDKSSKSLKILEDNLNSLLNYIKTKQ